MLENPDENDKPEKKQVLQLFFIKKCGQRNIDWEAAVSDFGESSIMRVTKSFLFIWLLKK